MILCLCNGVNERSVRDIIRKDKIRSEAKVYREIGYKQCGKCGPYIKDYIERDKKGLL